MSRLSKLGYSLSSSSASSSFSSSVSPFKDRRTPTIPCRSFVPDCSPIRSAGVPSFTEVRRGSYLATRSSRASATAPAPAPARSAPSISPPSTRFARAPVPARTGTGEPLTRSYPLQSRGAAQQDLPLVVRSIMERARLRSQAIRARHGLPERPPVEVASVPSVPTRPTRFTERIRLLAEEAAARSANHRATLSKLAAFDEVVARVRARKQSTSSAPSNDAARPVTRSERARPSAPSVNAARPITRSERARPSAPSAPSVNAARPVTRSERFRPSAPSVNATRPVTRSERFRPSAPSAPSVNAARPVTRSERFRPSAPSVNATRPATHSEQARLSASSIFERISDRRAAQAERRRWIDDMIAQQRALAATRAASSAAIEQFRAKRQARLANRSREGHLTSPHRTPTNGTRSTAIPAADLVRTQSSTAPADRLRKDKPAKRVRFGDVTVQPVSRWIVPRVHVFKRCS